MRVSGRGGPGRARLDRPSHPSHGASPSTECRVRKEENEQKAQPGVGLPTEPSSPWVELILANLEKLLCLFRRSKRLEWNPAQAAGVQRCMRWWAKKVSTQAEIVLLLLSTL